MTTWKKTQSEDKTGWKRVWAGRFHGHPGKLLNGKGGLEGMLKGQRNKRDCSRNICNMAGADGLCDLSDGWCLWPLIDWTLGKKLEREALTLLRFVLFSVRLQQLRSFPAKNTLTGFSCSLNFHKAYSSYRKICHILKWLAPCNPLYEKWSFMSLAFSFSFHAVFWAPQTCHMFSVLEEVLNWTEIKFHFCWVKTANRITYRHTEVTGLPTALSFGHLPSLHLEL